MAYADDISGAPDITTGDGTWDNLAATDNPGEPANPAGSSNNNVWQKVFLTAAGTYRFSHDTTPSGDTVLAVYTGPPAAGYADLTLAGFGDDEAGNSKPQVSYASPGGEWVYLESSGYGGDRVSGQATLWALAALPPGWFDSGYWGAKVSDCGPYVGDWPPYPPLPATFALEPDASQLDYFVAIPNPDGLAADVADNSYDTTITDLWRDGASGSDWGRNLSTSGSAVADYSAAPPGAHLFVFWYDGAGTVPAHTGPELAPANMAGGGTAAPGQFATGATWSDWIPDISVHDGTVEIPETALVNRQNHWSITDGSEIAGTPSNTVDMANAGLQAAIAGGAVAGSVYSGTYGPADSGGPAAPVGAINNFEIRKETRPSGVTRYTTISPEYTGLGFTAEVPPLPDTAPQGLTPGLDFVLTVDMLTTGIWWQRDTSIPQQVHWGHLPGLFWIRSVTERDDPTSVIADMPGELRIVAAPDISEATMLTWDVGATLWSLVDPHPGEYAPLFGPGLFIDVDLSTLTGSTIHLIGQHSTLRGDYLPAPEAASPPSGNFTYSSAADEYFSDILGTGVPTATVTLPPYRYLIPHPEVRPYLRMNQRGDGLGISPARRIGDPGGNTPRSEQRAAVRRLGGSNTFT